MARESRSLPLNAAEEVRESIYQRDKAINDLLKGIRRKIVRHLTINPGTDAPAALALIVLRAVDQQPGQRVRILLVDDQALFPSALPARRETSYNAWVTIQIGCDNNCAFCIVPAVRGVEISRPYADIVAEVERLAADGVTEVTLLDDGERTRHRVLFGDAQSVILRRDGS